MLSQLWEEIKPSLRVYKEEADTLVEADTEWNVDEHPHTLHERLVTVSNSLRELNRLVTELGLVRSRCRAAVKGDEEAFEDAKLETMQKTRIGEYTSASERDMTYTSGAIDELIKLRKTKKMLSEVEEIYDYCQSKYRGLDNRRRDLEARVRIVNMENYLSS